MSSYGVRIFATLANTKCMSSFFKKESLRDLLTFFQKWPFRIVGVVHFSAGMCLKGGLEGPLEA